MKESAAHILDKYPISHNGVTESIRALYARAANHLRLERLTMNYPMLEWGNRSLLDQKYAPKDGGSVIGTGFLCCYFTHLPLALVLLLLSDTHTHTHT